MHVPGLHATPKALKSLRFLYVTILPLLHSSAATRQSKSKQGRAQRQQRAGKEQTMAEQMITSESGKQQKVTAFAPFCYTVLAVHFGQFGQVSVLPR